MGFIVATGVECSAPMIRGGIRRDQLVLTGHRERFSEDFAAVAGLGIQHLRYGVPFHLVAHAEDRFDWAWTDGAMAAMADHGIEPIVDLLHFGVPDRLTGVGDARLPAVYRAYVRAFVERYPDVRWYTPVNEPFITALYSARLGWWNELRTSDRAFVRALDTLATCAVDGMRIIREHRPDAIFLQSDACESFRPDDPSDESAVRAARFLQERSWMGFDLTYGRVLTGPVRRWLGRAGMTAARLEWFEANGSDEGCIVGLDYYEANEHLVDAAGQVRGAPRSGFGTLARAAHARYGLPFMLAETNNTTERAIPWLTEVWNDSVNLYLEGLPVAGFCWYSLTDQVDWDTCMREANDRVNSFGLVDLERRRRPVAAVYETLAHAARSTGPQLLPVIDDETAA